MVTSESLVWETDGRDWPNRAASRFVEADGFPWHVQVMGRGPVLLLLHGTGASTHSWRALLPLLADDFTLVAPDLPGHGFTRTPGADTMSLPGMARSVAALLDALAMTPDLVAGHSAGAAVAVRMALDRRIAPRGILGLNAALLPIGGAVGQMLSPFARLVSQTALVPKLFARHAADPAVVERLIRRTGSRLDETGLALYGRLAGNPVHAAAALAMMAEWDLWSFERDLPALNTPLVLVVGGRDGTIAPADAFRVRDLLPAAKVEYLRGLGHLAHEERPDLVAALVRHYAEGLTRVSS